MTQTLVISDVDGTLVPHLYFSDLSPQARESAVRRMERLCQHPRFGIVTGRRRASLDALFASAGFPGAPDSCRLLACEFGAHIQSSGSLVRESPQDPHVLRVHGRLQEALAQGTLPRSDGRFPLRGVFVEHKPSSVQIDWDLGDAAANLDIFREVSVLVNGLVLEHSLGMQVFRNRVDVLAPSFQPKRGLVPWILRAFPEVRSGPHELVLLGDELYDNGLFEEFLQGAASSLFSSIRALSVEHHLPSATGHLETTEDALDLAEKVLGI